LENLAFTLLVGLTVIPAYLVAVTLNIVRAACWLLVSLAGAAGLFFFLGADFVGATQLLIYVGGTLVLLIFGVMLTATGPFVSMATRSGDWVLSIVAGAGMLALLVYCIGQYDWRAPPVAAAADLPPTSNEIGLALLGLSSRPPAPAELGSADSPLGPAAAGYLLPFEIVSVHLVVVLIGAAYLARAKQRRTQESGE
jgi:NADH:ubiquinone oxidoreductase subunit 6 (subunit J)